MKKTGITKRAKSRHKKLRGRITEMTVSTIVVLGRYPSYMTKQHESRTH